MKRYYLASFSPRNGEMILMIQMDFVRCGATCFSPHSGEYKRYQENLFNLIIGTNRSISQ